SPHDPVGTNLFGHVLRGRLMRVVPRENEAINETWIADRDRFSYEGIYSPDRLTTALLDRKSTRLNSSHLVISYAVFCLKKNKHATCLEQVPAIWVRFSWVGAVERLV